MTTAIRFTLVTGDVNFYDDEILEVTLGHKRDFQLQESQSSYPNLFIESNSWISITIEFHEMRSTTKAKIDQVIDEKSPMVCYYDYAYSGIGNPVNVIFYPDGRTKTYNYYGGELAARITHKLTFLQSS